MYVCEVCTTHLSILRPKVKVDWLTLQRRFDPLTLVSSRPALSGEGMSSRRRDNIGKNTCVCV